VLPEPEQSERPSEKATVSEAPPPQTADNAVRAFILLFALGFVLRGIDVMDTSMSDAIQKWIIAAAISVADYFYVPIRTALGPRFTSTASKVGTDFRWWIGAVLVVLLWAAVAPTVEKHGWPSLTPKAEQIVIHDPPTAEDIAKASASIRAERDAALSNLASVAKERDDLSREANTPRQPSQPAQQPQNIFAATYVLSQTDIRKIRDEVFRIRESLPVAVSIQTADDNEARGVATALSKGLGFAGIQVAGMSIGYPITPQETGISIRVGDLRKIPDGARKLAEAIKAAVGVEPRYTAMQKLDPGEFRIFVGTNPKEN
jgi:hypothetical protein